MEKETDKPHEPWHLDKRVPIALILAILAQTFAAVWWAASVNSQVMGQQMQIDRQEASIQRLRDSTQTQEVSSARLSQELSDVQRTLARLEQGQQQTNEYLRGLFTQNQRK